MTGAKIVGLRPDHEDELILEETPVYADADADEPVRDSGGGWIVPVLLGLTAVAWIAFVTWAVLAGPAAYANLAMIIGAASAPLALIGVVGVLALRTSRRESQRFLSTAQGMRAESSRLEARIAELTARIDANREALADQTVQLTQIGEEASARLATIVATVRDDGAKLDKHADLLGEAAARAGNEVNALLAALPKAQEQTSGIAAALNDAGETAMGQVSALEAQLSELAARGREADEIASGAAQRLAVHLAQIQSTTETARAQLDTSAEQMSEAVQTALSRAAEALEEARRSVEAQGAAMLAMVDQSKATLDTTGGQASEALSARIAEITVHVETLGRTIGAHDETGRALVERLSAGLGEVEQRLERLDQSGTARTEQLATAMERLSEHADRLSTSLAGAGDAADGFIARSESLLTALDASAREIDETLPAALARLDGHAEASRVRIEAMRQPVGEIEAGATSALDRLAQTEKLLQQQREAIELFGQAADRQLQAGKRSATELAAAIDTAHGQMAAVADGSGPQLIDVMLRVRDTANQAAERARETFERIVPQAAASIGHAADKAIEDVIGDRIERQVLAVAEAAERAVTAANAAAALLQDQIAKVEQGTATLEARVESARERSEEASGESFSRRASLLMEALNSTAIDVAKILSNEVTDSAWAAYLKGDRGVFTRRAVRLLEAGESRTILGYYESDPEFRDQVSRYIHDFEAMLRNVLATREGSQIAITLLSSDMGKLYVALAQAIERLRA
jgi:predicted  nucleic acid-binding Zn-ribbon protein